jgi:hypothetical protein
MLSNLPPAGGAVSVSKFLGNLWSMNFSAKLGKQQNISLDEQKSTFYVTGKVKKMSAPPF